MKALIRACRFYFWPIITANLLAMTAAVGGDLWKSVLFAGAVSCLATFGFLLNDLWDIGIDVVNQPGHFERTDPKVLLAARAITPCFMLLGLALAGYVGSAELACAAVIALSLVAYTIVLRTWLFVPNLLTALLAVCPLWIPLALWSTESDRGLWLFVLANTVIVFGREIMMDVRDMYGDLSGGRRTYATVCGPEVAKRLSMAITVFGCFLLLGVIASRGLTSSFAGSAVSGIAVALLISGVLMYSSRQAAASPAGQLHAIHRYVTWSRRAMVFVPIVTALMWFR